MSDVTHSVAAIVLAGGLSRRMGSSKPLALLRGQPLLAHVLDRLEASKSVSPIVVVTGHLAEQLQPILSGRAVIVAHNVDYAEGEMLSSIKTGIRALPANVDAVLLALCDQPMVNPATIATLVATWTTKRSRILIPRFDGKRGHPIMLGRAGFEEILSLDRSATLKAYTSAHPAETMELDVEDAAVARDIDTPSDLAAEQKRDG